MEIIKNDQFKIIQDEFDDKMYTIFFNSNSQALISSITKTKILLGATTTQKYNSISFKATKVQTFKEYQFDLERENGTKKLQYNSILKMTYNLANQLNFLITNFSKTFLGYSPENLIVVDKNKRGLGLGFKIIKYLTDIAKEEKCYKVILNCSEENVTFYEKCGFKQKSKQMSLYF